MNNQLYQNIWDKVGNLLNLAFSNEIDQQYKMRYGQHMDGQLASDFENKIRCHTKLTKRFDEPVSLKDVLEDNYFRLGALGFIDRLIIVRQTSLFSSFHSVTGKDSLISNLNLARKGGLYRGALRGYFLGLVQFYGTTFAAVTSSHESRATLIPSLVTLDAILHPLDTLRTRFMADVSGSYRNLGDAMRNTAPTQLLNGLLFKLGFSLVYGNYLLSATGSSSNVILNSGLLLAAYPLWTAKSICQVANNSGTVLSDIGFLTNAIRGESAAGTLRTLYRGFLPFFALNQLVPFVFPQIWSKCDQEAALDEAWRPVREAVDIAKKRH
jgi:hypothetical protein